MLDLVNWLDEHLLKHLTPYLLQKYPNTYAYTKCLTEQLVSEYMDKIPIAVARPSISKFLIVRRWSNFTKCASTVTASLLEPFPGWVDNLNGPTGIIVGAGKGVIRTMHCNGHYNADIIPVDIVVNETIIIAKERGETSQLERPMVYNLSVDEVSSVDDKGEHKRNENKQLMINVD